MESWAKGFLLASPPNKPPLHGPLPYYQLADSKEGAGDASQCAKTTAKCLASGLTLEKQDKIKEIGSHFKPDDLWACIKKMAEKFTGQL